MKIIFFIMILFCIAVKAETADTLKLSNGNVLLLNNDNPVLLAGESIPDPPVSSGNIHKTSNGLIRKDANGRTIKVAR